MTKRETLKKNQTQNWMTSQNQIIIQSHKEEREKKSENDWTHNTKKT